MEGLGAGGALVKRAIVTGGRGFVGAWLCAALLERGVEVTSFDRRSKREKPSTLAMIGISDQVDEQVGDLVDGELLAGLIAEREIDSVFHLGAETIVGTVQADPIGALESNVRGTWTLLQARARGWRRALHLRLLRQGLRRP